MKGTNILLVNQNKVQGLIYVTLSICIILNKLYYPTPKPHSQTSHLSPLQPSALQITITFLPVSISTVTLCNLVSKQKKLE